jgi:hypothetical protein
MRRAIIAVLTLASGSSQASQAVVSSIGSHQYMVTDAGKQVFAKANETCAKLGRTMMPLGVPPEEAGIDFGKQFKFECILAYEIVPGGQGTYTIHVPSEKMLAPVDRVCPLPTCPIKAPVTQLPDIGTASEQTEHLARTYCAKTHKTMVVTGGEFDMGPGFTLIFKCVPPQHGAPRR